MATRHGPEGGRWGSKCLLVGESKAFWVSGGKEGAVKQHTGMQQLISTCFNNHPGGVQLIQEETMFSISA